MKKSKICFLGCTEKSFKGPIKGTCHKQKSQHYFLQRCSKKFSSFCSANPEIIEVKVEDRQTESQNLETNTCAGGFFSSLNLPSLCSLHLQGD
jgi:hypothetical protein